MSPAPRYAQKKDGNQAEIVKALRKAGIRVYVMHQPVDLLVGQGTRVALLEVKRPKEKPRSAPQIEFLSEWANTVRIVTTPENAVQAALEALRINREELHGT